EGGQHAVRRGGCGGEQAGDATQCAAREGSRGEAGAALHEEITAGGHGFRAGVKLKGTPPLRCGARFGFATVAGRGERGAVAQPKGARERAGDGSYEPVGERTALPRVKLPSPALVPPDQHAPPLDGRAAERAHD